MGKEKSNYAYEKEIGLLKQQIKVSVDLSNRLMLGNLAGMTHNDTRDTWKVFGYPTNLTLDHYLSQFFRGGIAKTIVEAYPKACWAEHPQIEDDSEMEDETDFEKAYHELCKDNRIKFYSRIKQVDILSGVGRFGILFIGVRDGLKFEDPLTATNLNLTDILYISAFSEKNAVIAEYDEDVTSPRYGLPLYYNLKTGGFNQGSQNGSGSQIMKEKQIKVHFSRVIHIAEDTLENDVFGTPRLEPVYNHLIDLLKVTGGGPETFWLNSRGGLNINAPVDANIKDPELLETKLTEFTNNLTRYLRTKGMDVRELNFNVADPKEHFNMLLSALSAITRIPKRILMGSEQGELASSQDEKNWNTQVSQRQKNHCESNILRPVVEWFIRYGILPEPKDGYFKYNWPPLGVASDIEKADSALKKANALAAYVNSNGADMICTPQQFMEEIMGMEYREDELPETSDFDTIEEPQKEEDYQKPVS